MSVSTLVSTTVCTSYCTRAFSRLRHPYELRTTYYTVEWDAERRKDDAALATHSKISRQA